MAAGPSPAAKPAPADAETSWSAVNETNGDPSASTTRPSRRPVPSSSATVTETGSAAITWALAAPTSTRTAGTCGAAITAARATGFGRPISKPELVSANDSGIGNTGWGEAPKTSPEYHRFDGGTSPGASRTGSIFATGACVTAPTSAAVSTFGTLASGGPGTEPEADAPGVGAEPAPVVHEASSVATTTATTTGAR